RVPATAATEPTATTATEPVRATAATEPIRATAAATPATGSVTGCSVPDVRNAGDLGRSIQPLVLFAVPAIPLTMRAIAILVLAARVAAAQSPEPTGKHPRILLDDTLRAAWK